LVWLLWYLLLADDGIVVVVLLRWPLFIWLLLIVVSCDVCDDCCYGIIVLLMTVVIGIIYGWLTIIYYYQRCWLVVTVDCWRCWLPVPCGVGIVVVLLLFFWCTFVGAGVLLCYWLPLLRYDWLLLIERYVGWSLSWWTLLIVIVVGIIVTPQWLTMWNPGTGWTIDYGGVVVVRLVPVVPDCYCCSSLLLIVVVVNLLMGCCWWFVTDVLTGYVVCWCYCAVLLPLLDWDDWLLLLLITLTCWRTTLTLLLVDCRFVVVVVVDCIVLLFRLPAVCVGVLLVVDPVLWLLLYNYRW